jgi:hypothetical protein
LDPASRDPLSHSYGDDEAFTLNLGKRTFHVLQKADIFTC